MEVENMAQAHFIAIAKDSLVLELPQEATALGIKPGARVSVTVDTGAVEEPESKNRKKRTRSDHRKRSSALGKYAFVAGGSEEFAKEKQTWQSESRWQVNQ
jgi:hypothetical protein